MLDPTTLRVLLIEDNPFDAHLVRRALESGGEGLALEWSTRLEEGLERLQRESFDALLLDLGLSETWGLESLDRVRQRAPDLPVVVLTGDDDARLAHETFRRGAQDFMIKGRFDPGELRRALRYAIERQRAEGQRREQQAIHRLVTEHASDPILTIDQQGIVAQANRAACALFGEPSLVGRDLRDILRHEGGLSLGALLDGYLRSGERLLDWNHAIFVWRGGDGGERRAEVSLGQFHLDGRAYFTGIFRPLDAGSR
jgi:PAS domain S-box-containing protein